MNNKTKQLLQNKTGEPQIGLDGDKQQVNTRQRTNSRSADEGEEGGGRVLGGGGGGRMIKSIGSIIFNLSEFTQRSFEPELGAKLQ